MSIQLLTHHCQDLIGMFSTEVDFLLSGAAFLSISTTYTMSGSGFVTPSGAAKAGVENLTR